MSSVRYELEGAVGVITLDRPPRNAYDHAMHVALEHAWWQAARDDAAKVIVLRAEGQHFCAGGDLEKGEGKSADDHDAPESPFLQSGDFYRFCRDVPKPTIAAVQGACVGGGLRFVWPCDLVVAAEGAFFGDPTVRFGLGGIQAHGHTWEWGPRLAKELLFTGGRLPAERLYQLGMVNRVVPLDALRQTAMELAAQIAEQPARSLREAKRAVNNTLDAMGQHLVVSRFNELMDGFDGATLRKDG